MLQKAAHSRAHKLFASINPAASQDHNLARNTGACCERWPLTTQQSRKCFQFKIRESSVLQNEAHSRARKRICQRQSRTKPRTQPAEQHGRMLRTLATVHPPNNRAYAFSSKFARVLSCKTGRTAVHVKDFASGNPAANQGRTLPCNTTCKHAPRSLTLEPQSRQHMQGFTACCVKWRHGEVWRAGWQ